MKDFKGKIQEKVDIGTLQEVSPGDLQDLLKMEHHFTYLGVVSNENSDSTSTCLINNTRSSVPNQGTSFSYENKKQESPIGDSYSSLLEFCLRAYGLSAAEVLVQACEV